MDMSKFKAQLQSQMPKANLPSQPKQVGYQMNQVKPPVMQQPPANIPTQPKQVGYQTTAAPAPAPNVNWNTMKAQAPAKQAPSGYQMDNSMGYIPPPNNQIAPNALAPNVNWNTTTPNVPLNPDVNWNTIKQTAPKAPSGYQTTNGGSTYFGNGTDIGLARQTGLTGNFVDTTGMTQDQFLAAAAKYGNASVLGGNLAQGGISDEWFNLANQGGGMQRLAGANRTETQEAFSNAWQKQQENAAKSEYDRTQAQNKQQQDKFRSEYENSQAKQDASKWAGATIDDIAKKYGFDYSRDYAKQQAEAEAQALRNANQDAQRRNESNKKTGTAAIDNNLMNMAEGLDRNYFQQMMAQQQGQVNSGLNGGIASDQDLRLQMNRQAEMGASYRDANLGKMKINENFNLDDLRLAEQMGLIDQQSLAREDSLYNDRMQQGFGNLMTEREMANARDQQQWSQMFSEVGRLDGLDQNMWGRSQAEIDRAMQQKRYSVQDSQWNKQFDYTAGQDAIDNRQWEDQFSYGKQRDGVADKQWQSTFDYGKTRDGVADRQWADEFNYGKQRDLVGDAQWEKQFNEDVRQFGMQYALQKQAASYRGGGGGGSTGGSSSRSSSQTPLAKSYSSYQSDKSRSPQTASDKHYMGRQNQLDQVYGTIAKSKGVNKATLPYSNDLSARIAKQRIMTAPTPVSKKLALFGL